MNIKKIIKVSSIFTTLIFITFIIGMFFSGLTVFSGAYNYDALSALSTLFAALFGPLVSLIAAVLFYSSLVSQKESIKIQKEEFSEFVTTNDFNIQNLNFSLVLTEIKDFNASSFLKVENHFSSTTEKKLKEIELINEMKLHLNNPGKALKKPQVIIGDDLFILKDFINCETGDKIIHKGHSCQVLLRKNEEIIELERIERRFWILFGTMYTLINHSNNKEVFMKIFASILPYEYFEYSLGLFAKRGGYPDSNIINELLNFYKYETRGSLS